MVPDLWNTLLVTPLNVQKTQNVSVSPRAIALHLKEWAEKKWWRGRQSWDMCHCPGLKRLCLTKKELQLSRSPYWKQGQSHVEIIPEGDELNEENPYIAGAFIEKHARHVFPLFCQRESAYLRVTARRERQNHIVSEPDIEPGLSPATDLQVLEVAQAVATRESKVGQSAISCANQWNDWPVCIHVFLFHCLLLF